MQRCEHCNKHQKLTLYDALCTASTCDELFSSSSSLLTLSALRLLLWEDVEGEWTACSLSSSCSTPSSFVDICSLSFISAYLIMFSVSRHQKGFTELTYLLLIILLVIFLTQQILSRFGKRLSEFGVLLHSALAVTFLMKPSAFSIVYISLCAHFVSFSCYRICTSVLFIVSHSLTCYRQFASSVTCRLLIRRLSAMSVKDNTRKDSSQCEKKRQLTCVIKCVSMATV